MDIFSYVGSKIYPKKSQHESIRLLNMTIFFIAKTFIFHLYSGNWYIQLTNISITEDKERLMEYSKFIETKDTQLLDTMCDPGKKKHFLQ